MTRGTDEQYVQVIVASGSWEAQALGIRTNAHRTGTFVWVAKHKIATVATLEAILEQLNMIVIKMDGT